MREFFLWAVILCMCLVQVSCSQEVAISQTILDEKETSSIRFLALKKLGQQINEHSEQFSPHRDLFLKILDTNNGFKTAEMTAKEFQFFKREALAILAKNAPVSLLASAITEILSRENDYLVKADAVRIVSNLRLLTLLPILEKEYDNFPKVDLTAIQSEYEDMMEQKLKQSIRSSDPCDELPETTSQNVLISKQKAPLVEYHNILFATITKLRSFHAPLPDRR